MSEKVANDTGGVESDAYIAPAGGLTPELVARVLANVYAVRALGYAMMVEIWRSMPDIARTRLWSMLDDGNRAAISLAESESDEPAMCAHCRRPCAWRRRGVCRSCYRKLGAEGAAIGETGHAEASRRRALAEKRRAFWNRLVMESSAPILWKRH